MGPVAVAGNVAFRPLIERSFSRHDAGNMCAREKINREIVELVKAQPGAPRFLKKNHPTTKVWKELLFRKSAEKASQSFRNARSSAMSKATSDDESEVDDDDSGAGDDDESFDIQDLRSKNNEQGDE